jgi:hypothetical protein
MVKGRPFIPDFIHDDLVDVRSPALSMYWLQVSERQALRDARKPRGFSEMVFLAFNPFLMNALL